MNVATVDKISKKPAQWGLRGDPFLWEEMRCAFTDTYLPNRACDFIACVVIQFEELTGTCIFGSEDIFVERFNSGGMSSGFVSPEWWRTHGVPILRRQYKSAVESEESG